MKCWVSAMALILLAVVGDSEITLSSLLQNRRTFSLSYEYRIDLNISEAFPSINAAINELRNDTLAAIKMLEEDGDDPLFLIGNLTSQVQSTCQSSSDVCVLVETTATLSLRLNVDDRLVVYAALEEVQSFLETFIVNHQNVTATFAGPFVVRTDVRILLQGVIDRMTEVEISIFEAAFMEIIGPPLQNNDQSIELWSVTVFLQQMRENMRSRRLQASSGNASVVVSIRVTGQCNQCSNNDFTRIMGEAVDIRRPDFERKLRDKGQETGTDYFDNVSARITTMDKAPGISDCCLDFYPPPEPFPFWVILVTGACVVIITTAVCCAACRSKRERNKKQQAASNSKVTTAIAPTMTDEASEEDKLTNEPEGRTKRVSSEVMPHLRAATQQRLARERDPRASSLTF